jgi:hypothetical protein
VRAQFAGGHDVVDRMPLDQQIGSVKQ